MPSDLIGQLVALPWDEQAWMVGVVIRLRIHNEKSYYYDIYWCAPDGTHKTLRSYNDREINTFTKCLQDAKLGLQPQPRLYRAFLEEYRGNI